MGPASVHSSLRVRDMNLAILYNLSFNNNIGASFLTSADTVLMINRPRSVLMVVEWVRCFSHYIYQFNFKA